MKMTVSLEDNRLQFTQREKNLALEFSQKTFSFSGAVFLRHLTFFFLFWSINGVWTLEGQIRQSLLFIESCPYTVLGQEKASVFCKQDQLWWLWDYGSVAESDVIWEGNRTLKACLHSITSRGTDSSWNQVLCLLYSVFKITGVPSKFPACGFFFFVENLFLLNKALRREIQLLNVVLLGVLMRKQNSFRN